MDLFPIVDDSDHTRALRAVDALWDAEEGTPEAATLDAFATLIDAYERRRWPIEGRLDPIELLRYAIDEQGRTLGELASLVGEARASEILRRERPLTLSMIRSISDAWGIPMALLAIPYRVSRKGTLAKPERGTPRRAKA